MFLATMSSVHYLKEFISARLTAAAEEIFTEFEKTIEEEIDRRCRMLEITLKPQTADLVLFDISETKVYLTDQPGCNQDGSATVDQQQAEPPKIKEQQEELCISPQEKQLALKNEPENRDNVENESNSEQVFIQNSFSKETLKCEGSNREEPESGKNKDRNRSNNDENNSNNKRNNSAFKKEKTKKLFKCDLCGKTLTQKGNLIIHRRIHTGEKPYRCVTCGKGFIAHSGLTEHMISHTGVKPYACTTCGLRCTNKGHLIEHIRTHTGVKPFSCETCGKSFARNRNLTMHKNKAHKESPAVEK